MRNLAKTVKNNKKTVKNNKKTDETTKPKSVYQTCIMQYAPICKDKKGVWLAGNYYQALNTLFFPSGRVSICKACMKEYVYYLDGSLNLEKFKKILAIIDIPYFVKDVESAIGDPKDTIGIYMKNMQLNKKGLSFEDGDIGSFNVTGDISKDILDDKKALSKIKLHELYEKWGYGYESEEIYMAFEKKYLLLKNSYPEKTSMHSEALLKYIRYAVMSERCVVVGDVKGSKDWADLAHKAATAAQINPSQLSKSDLLGGLSTVGELVKAIEESEDVIPILPQYKEAPQDKIDFTIWCYINYIRDLFSLPLCEYNEVYDFYRIRKEEYIAGNKGTKMFDNDDDSLSDVSHIVKDRKKTSDSGGV